MKIDVKELINKQFEPISYSSAEVVIGTWIDGNPIYRKVLAPFGAKQYAYGETNTINVGVSIDVLIRFDVLIKGNNNGNQEVNKYIVPGRYSSAQTVTIECNSQYQTNQTYIILEYTKV